MPNRSIKEVHAQCPVCSSPWRIFYINPNPAMCLIIVFPKFLQKTGNRNGVGRNGGGRQGGVVILAVNWSE